MSNKNATLVPLVETTAVQDTFATELSSVERLGLNFRFVLSAMGHCYPDGARERVIVAKIVMPADAVRAAIELASEAMEPAVPVVPLRIV